jgi:hypothetical protein
MYAFVMGDPKKEAVIPSLAGNAKQGVGRIQSVELLGADPAKFTQDETGLKVQMPDKLPSEYVVTLKIIGALAT